VSTDTDALVSSLRRSDDQYQIEAADTIERLTRERDEAVARERERCAAVVQQLDCAHKCGIGHEVAAAIRTTKATT
jgi:hypothetical protein